MATEQTDPAAPQNSGDPASKLGTEPVGSLLLRFSIPAIVGMLVNALYNVVDRIFVGRGVNEVALGGLALVLPLMTISMAFAMLFGFGAANMISMRLGQGKREEAEQTLNHCFFLLLGIGVLVIALGLAFLEPVISRLGAREGSGALMYARQYFRIILYGQVFFMLSFGFSHCTRAQGFPLVSMIGMFIGAGTNIILDPLFIFLFRWGVEGAAWATIISQAVSAAWLLSFNLTKKAVLRLRPGSCTPSAEIISRIMRFGSAQFLLQFMMSAVQFIYNASMDWYGAADLGVSNGGDIALSGINMVNAVLLLIMMPVFGINQGSQPILGYNYGAKKFDRVIAAYIRAVAAAMGICFLGFLPAQIFPRALVGLFAPNGSPALLEFTPWAMRVMMLLLPLSGFQVVSANVFVATGRPNLSIILSMLRQCIILIPCMLIFGRIWGLHGVIAAMPVAEGAAFLLTALMIFLELKKLSRPLRP
ncbi:MAG: MATE family efflux transporter [Spirochaetaceae bacterium]|jgi:putative MATE family efflux protein|nr:MATE family efflux transporter [Spirochaetaceae bacterium]